MTPPMARSRAVPRASRRPSTTAVPQRVHGEASGTGQSGTLRGARRRRIRARVRGTATRPRLSVFRSARHLFVQLIDDAAGRTVLAVGDQHLPEGTRTNEKGAGKALALGKLLATRAQERGIRSVVFDRSGYAYAGRVKAIADGAREGGLKF